MAVHVHSKVSTSFVQLDTLKTERLQQYDILQLIKIKKDHGSLNLVIIGGAGAPSVSSNQYSLFAPLFSISVIQIP